MNTSAPQPQLRRTVSITAATAILVGGSGLAGWLFTIRPLLSIAGDTPALSPLTAIGLFIAGIALWLAPEHPRYARGLGVVVIAVAALAAAGYLLGTSFGLTDLLDALPHGAGTLPGLPAPNSTLALALIGIALVSITRPAVAQATTLLALGIAYLAALAELFGASMSEGLSAYTAMSPQTILGLFALTGGILCATASAGVMSLVVDCGAAGLAVRRFLPVAIVLPFVLGGLRIAGETAGAFDARFGTALMTFAAAALAGMVTIDVAVAIRDLDQRLGREHSARAVAESESRLKDGVLTLLTQELRTPASAIHAQVHLLQSGVLTPQRTHESMETLSRNASRLRKYVDDAVEVALLAQGGGLDRPVELDPREPFRAALDRWSPQITEKGITVTAELVPAGLVRGDAERLQRVANNLLSNAVKFTPSGGAIQVATAREDTFVRFTIADNGVGIERDFLPYVFDPFRRSSALAGGYVEGLGLGLAIVRHVVELHGGTVTASSDGAGRGARFTVRLPAVPAA